ATAPGAAARCQLGSGPGRARDPFPTRRSSDLGYRMLADALEANLPYRIDCPALLFCGVHDPAASTKRYNRASSEGEGLSLVCVPAAGHNSNTDNPVYINRQIGCFLHKLLEDRPQYAGRAFRL